MSYGQYIWNYFIDKIGNAYGVAGLMGNIYAESGYKPNNMENAYEGTYNDETYTSAVNNGSYSKSSFVNDSIGYGLCQWTYYARKQALYEMWKSGGYSSIADIELQCAYLWKELQTDFSGVLSVLKSATSIRQASDKVLHDFENPADQSASVEATRESYSKTAYNDYKGGSSSEPTQPTYNPRLSGGDLFSNKWYTAPTNPFSSSGYGLPNCTCYAWGRRGEITGEAPNTSLGDAFRWWGYNIDNNIYPYGQTPKLGAIACWDYGTGSGGHVAIVEQINSDGSIITSNSGWVSSEAVGTTENFYTQTLYPSKNYCWDRSNGGNLIFQGFIYLTEDYAGGGGSSGGTTPGGSTSKKHKLSKLLMYGALTSDNLF